MPLTWKLPLVATKASPASNARIASGTMASRGLRPGQGISAIFLLTARKWAITSICFLVISPSNNKGICARIVRLCVDGQAWVFCKKLDRSRVVRRVVDGRLQLDTIIYQREQVAHLGREWPRRRIPGHALPGIAGTC